MEPTEENETEENVSDEGVDKTTKMDEDYQSEDNEEKQGSGSHGEDNEETTEYGTQQSTTETIKEESKPCVDSECFPDSIFSLETIATSISTEDSNLKPTIKYTSSEAKNWLTSTAKPETSYKFMVSTTANSIFKSSSKIIENETFASKSTPVLRMKLSTTSEGESLPVTKTNSPEIIVIIEDATEGTFQVASTTDQETSILTEFTPEFR